MSVQTVQPCISPLRQRLLEEMAMRSRVAQIRDVGAVTPTPFVVR